MTPGPRTTRSADRSAPTAEGNDRRYWRYHDRLTQRPLMIGAVLVALLVAYFAFKFLPVAMRGLFLIFNAETVYDPEIYPSERALVLLGSFAFGVWLLFVALGVWATIGLLRLRGRLRARAFADTETAHWAAWWEGIRRSYPLDPGVQRLTLGAKTLIVAGIALSLGLASGIGISTGLVSLLGMGTGLSGGGDEAAALSTLMALRRPFELLIPLVLAVWAHVNAGTAIDRDDGVEPAFAARRLTWATLWATVSVTLLFFIIGAVRAAILGGVFV